MKKENPKILNEFLNYLITMNYSIGTVVGYNSDLLIFFKFEIDYLGLGIELKDINIFILTNIKRSDILAFTVFLNYNRENNWATRKRKLASIKKFYDWLYSTYSTMNSKENPMGRGIKVQPVLRLPKYLKLEEAKSLQHIFNINNSRNSLRNNTIIILFLNTGMRLSELSNIRINDINLKDKKINIIGKGNRERILYLNTICMKYITDYLSAKKKY